MSPIMRVIGTLFYKFFLAGLNFVTSILTARFLGAAGRGYLTITINNLAAYSPVVGAFSEYIPYGINKRKHPVQHVFSTALWFCMLLSGILFVAAVLGTPWLLHGFGSFTAQKTQTAWIAGLVAPFAIFTVYVTRLVWGLNELEWLNRLNTIQAFLFIPIFIISVWMTPKGHDSTFYAISGWLVSQIITAFVSGYVAVKHGKVKLLPRVDKKIRKEVIDFGLQQAGGRLLDQANYRIDVYMVFILLGAAHTGVYSIATTVAEMLLFVSGSIQQVVLTRMASLDVKDSAQLTARTFRHTGVVILGSMILMYAVIPELIRFAYGSAFVGAIPKFEILLPGIALYGMSTVLTTFFTNQLGKPKVNIVLEIISIVVNVCVSIFLLPKLGESGAALAKTSAFFAIFLFSIGYFSYITKYPFYKLFYLQADEIQQYKTVFRKLRDRLQRKPGA